MLLSGMAMAQTNSVALRDGSGTLISSHASVTDAYSAIPATLTQAYAIEMSSAYTGSTETFPIVFVAKTGASAANTITLRPASGVTSMTIQSSVTGPIINLNDADYVVIDGRANGTGAGVLTVRNNSTASGANTIQLINGACFNTIRNLDVQNSTTTGTGRAVAISTSASNTSGNSDNQFRYCDFTGGRYMFNNSGTTANPNTRNTIYGCNFKNPVFAGYWGQAGSARVRIDSCSFFCTTPISETLYFGVLFDSQADSAIIVNNRFYNLQVSGGGTVRYVHVRSVVTSGTNVAEIRNNFFSMMTGNTGVANIAAIELSSGGSLFKARVAHNSIRFGGTLSSGGTSGNVGSSGLLVSSTNAATTFSVLNNLFVNERSGGSSGLQHVAMAITNTVSVFNIAGNTYNSTSGNLVRWGAVPYTTIPAYQSAVAGGEPTANNAAVAYVSATDLHLACGSAGNGSLTAAQIPDITTDIDGELRSATTHRGADQSASTVTVSLNVIGQNSPSCNGQSTGSATVAASGSSNYTYSWQPSGGNAATATGLTAGIYTVTAADLAGCSATQTLQITQPAAITTTLGTVSNVTCNGLTNGSVTVNASGGTGALSYSWAPSGGNAATATGLGAGTYTLLLKDANNCTATRTVAITQPAPVDASVTQNGLVLTANAGGATYQWINCATSATLAGQSAQSFTATANGSYQVMVTIGGCSATSTCVAIASVGIHEQAAIAGLKLYPNPGTGWYTLSVTEPAVLTVLNAIGEIVLQQSVRAGDTTLDLRQQPAGVYYVQLNAGDRSSVLKLIRQ